METTIEKTPLQLAEDLRFKILLLSENMKYAKENLKDIDIDLQASIHDIDVEVFKELATLLDREYDNAGKGLAFTYRTEHCLMLVFSKEIN